MACGDGGERGEGIEQMDVEQRGSGVVMRCWNWVDKAWGCFEQLML